MYSVLLYTRILMMISGWDGGDMMCLSVDQSDPVSWYRSHIEYISKLTNKFVLRTYFG